MRATERLNLTDQIGRELQRRYGFVEIDEFLRASGIEPPEVITVNSKWVYSKEALTKASEAQLLQIATDLNIQGTESNFVDQTPPKNWSETKLLRLFISHISKDKDKAIRLKKCLAPLGISGFVAHEDIHPTLKWQGEIERALRTMHAFICVLTPGFAASVWTQQEIGFAVCLGVKSISFKMGEDPTGFLSQEQALSRQGRTAEEVAKEIDALLSKDPRTADLLSAAKASMSEPASSNNIDDDVPF